MTKEFIIEMIGYLGSLLVLVSFVMTSVFKLRIVNSIGSFIFMVYALWFFIFAFMVYAFGAVVDSYLNSRIIRFSFIAPILMLVSMGLVVNGILDYMMDYVGLYSTLPLRYMLEIFIGFALAASSGVLHNRIKKNYGQKERPEGAVDEVQ